MGEVPYVFLDARYEKIRHGGSVVSYAVLMAFGVNQSGHRTVLGVSVSLSEAEVHWRDLFAHLQERGLSGVRLLISDDHAGLKTAREARFPGVPWQRCQHQDDNVDRSSRFSLWNNKNRSNRHQKSRAGNSIVWCATWLPNC